jgi:DNA-binding GntR family transcriptional regulator
MSSKYKEIATILNKAILDHRLMPGTKLGERELSELFDVSRIVIRQTLVRLSEDGLVVIERNRGAFVVKPSMQDAMDIYEAAGILEQGAIAQLSHRRSSADHAALRKHVHMQRRAIEAGNEAMADTLGQQFHMLLITLNKNKVIVDIYEQLTRKILLIRALYRAEFDYGHMLDEHEKLVDLIEKGRVKKAQDLLHNHNLSVSRSYVLEENARPARALAEELAPYLSIQEADRNKVTSLTDHRPRSQAKSFI